jgi:hypothetical protein
MVPIRGRVTVVPTQRIVPVENRNESRHRLRFLNLGNSSGLPFRSPFLDLMKSCSARMRAQHLLLRYRRVEGEPVSVADHHP